MKLYLIAGHGAGDSGAVGNGYKEAERVRALCSRIKTLGGNSVVYLDPSINYYASNKISTVSIDKGACILEVHMDSSVASAKGGHVIIPANYGGADKYDKSLSEMMKEMFPGRSNLIVERTDLANPKRAKARGLNYRLCEFGFISNSGDVKFFNDNLDLIATRVLKCFGINAAQVTTNVNKVVTSSNEPKRELLDVDGDYGEKSATQEQLFLRDKGYYKHAIDGKFGVESVKARQRFLNDNI